MRHRRQGSSSSLTRLQGRPKLHRSISDPDLQAMSEMREDKPTVPAKHYVRAPFPTLEEALKNVPEPVGFNVEIKYPLDETGKDHGLTLANMNRYVDTILEVPLCRLLASVWGWLSV